MYHIYNINVIFGFILFETLFRLAKAYIEMKKIFMTSHGSSVYEFDFKPISGKVSMELTIQCLTKFSMSESDNIITTFLYASTLSYM